MKNAKLLRRLRHIKETPIAPAWVMTAIEGRAAKVPRDADAQLDAMQADLRRVQEIRGRAVMLPPDWPLESTLL